MLPRPASMITGVVVAFALGAVVRLSSRSADPIDDASSSRSDRTHDLLERESQRAAFEPETPAPIEPAASEAGVDPTMILDLERSIDRFEDLATEGRRACDGLGEPFYDYEQPGAAGHAHIERWNAFAREWDDDVSRAAGRLPMPPSWDAAPDVVAVYNDVVSAMRELRHAAMGAGGGPVPYEADWNARFDEAERLLAQARTRLSAYQAP